MPDRKMTMARGRLAALAAVAAASALLAASPAGARTAVYLAPPALAPAELSAASASGDGLGLTIGLNETLAILFSQPLGLVQNSDTITIFTLPPPSGDARGTISIGAYNGGAPIIVRTRNINSGNSISIGNLFQLGCAQIGGCDFVAITTDRARRGASGVVLDYIDVNGEVTEITAPAPEPRAWALMILGFVALAARLKLRRVRARPSQPRLSPSSG
jgi:hypothetical protein